MIDTANDSRSAVRCCGLHYLPILLSASIGLSACATGGPPTAAAVPDQTRCTDPRPEICTMDYNPVCATLADGTTATRSNACGACADVEVLSHRPGACE